MDEVSGIPYTREAKVLLRELGIVDYIKNYVRYKTAYPVVVLGATGTGKSTFCESLCGKKTYIRRQDRTDESYHLTRKINETYLRIIDTPGQVRHSDKRFYLYRQLMSKPPIGIINVVSFGYHESTANLSEAIANSIASEDYLAERRKVELSLVNEWLGQLAGDGGPARWLLTVVTKADLWWQDGTDQSVITYYRDGAYGRSIEKSKHISHSVCSFSSLDNMFYGKQKMSGYYIDAQREADRSTLISLIETKVKNHDK